MLTSNPQKIEGHGMRADWDRPCDAGTASRRLGRTVMRIYAAMARKERQRISGRALLRPWSESVIHALDGSAAKR
jgi:hypothetical protein